MWGRSMSDNFIRCFFWLKPKPTEFLTTSVVVLVFSNLMPFYDVFYFHWEVFPILLLFLMENVKVGVFNICKMLTASPTVASMWVIKGFMIRSSAFITVCLRWFMAYSFSVFPVVILWWGHTFRMSIPSSKLSADISWDGLF
jgi:hypothetical protein